MRDYEMMYIIHPDQDAVGIKRIMDSLDERIGRDGTVTAHDLLGRRRLSYPMKKQTQGTYCLFNFTVDPAAIDDIQRFVHIEHHETVLRYLLLIDEKRGMRPPAQTLPDPAVAEAAAAAAAAAAKSEVEAVMVETAEGITEIAAENAPEPVPTVGAAAAETVEEMASTDEAVAVVAPEPAEGAADDTTTEPAEA